MANRTDFTSGDNSHLNVNNPQQANKASQKAGDKSTKDTLAEKVLVGAAAQPPGTHKPIQAHTHPQASPKEQKGSEGTQNVVHQQFKGTPQTTQSTKPTATQTSAKPIIFDQKTIDNYKSAIKI